MHHWWHIYYRCLEVLFNHCPNNYNDFMLKVILFVFPPKECSGMVWLIMQARWIYAAYKAVQDTKYINWYTQKVCASKARLRACKWRILSNLSKYSGSLFPHFDYFISSLACTSIEKRSLCTFWSSYLSAVQRKISRPELYSERLGISRTVSRMKDQFHKDTL